MASSSVCDPAVFAGMCTLAIKHLPTVPSMWYTCKAHGSWTLVLKAEGEEARSPCLLDCAQLHPTVRQTYLKLDFSTTLYSVKFLVTLSHLLHTKNVLLKELFIFLVIWIYSFIRYICTQRIDLIHFWKKKNHVGQFLMLLISHLSHLDQWKVGWFSCCLTNEIFLYPPCPCWPGL